MELKIDEERRTYDDATGIPVRALGCNGFESVDIACLDKESLLTWLKSRGGDNPWAEDVVGILLKHGHLHRKKDGD